MSLVVYNGVNLGLICTQQCEQVPETDPSGSDHIYSVIRLSFTSTIAGYNPDLIPGDQLAPARENELTASAVLKRIKHELELPRRPFKFVPAGADQPLYELKNGRDDATGPIPFGVSVT